MRDTKNNLVVAHESFMQAVQQQATVDGGTEGRSDWGNLGGQLSRKDQQLINGTWENVCNFLTQHNLGQGGAAIPTELTTGNTMAIEALNGSMGTGIAFTIGVAAIQKLCRDCGVPAKQLMAAVEAIGTMLTSMSSTANKQSYQQSFFNNYKGSPTNRTADSTHINLQDYLPKSLSPSIFGKISMEAFGANIDMVTPDIRSAITVALLQFQRGLIKRALHTRPAPQPIVEYIIDQGEVYDLMASMDPSAAVRNSQDSRVPLINLLADAGNISNTLKPIIPLMDNDIQNFLVADGWMKPNLKMCVYDLARRPGVVGYTQTDFTDLVAENVILDQVIVSLSKGGVTELFLINTKGYSRSRLTMQMNTQLSSDRGSLLNNTFQFTKNRKTVTLVPSSTAGSAATVVEGAPSTILANLTTEQCIQLSLNCAPSINLQMGYVMNLTQVEATAYAEKGQTVSQAVIDTMTGLQVGVYGFHYDMKWSEENLRKSVIATRVLRRTMTWEIPPGRNYMVDFSLNEYAPSQVLAYMTEVVSLGQDDRALRVITEVMKMVFDRVHAENLDVYAREMYDKIGFDYVASQLVRPVVYMGTFDIAEIQNIRSSDYYGDVRQQVESLLLNLLSKLNNDSYYPYRLNAGEKPVFKVVCSRIVMENLLSIPHIHNHLQAIGDAQQADGDVVEYTRVLPSGVILECHTVTFDAMRNVILIFPYRKSDPSSVLNFGLNHDCGMFTANYVPQLDGGAWRRILTNARAQLFPTCPIGVYLQVENLSLLTDMTQLLHVPNSSEPFAELSPIN